MLQYFLVAIGGALGAVCRYAVYNLSTAIGLALPWATLLINAMGAFLIGVAYVVLVENGNWPAGLQSLLGVGFLGAFTTYSTYSLDAWRLLEQGQVANALGYLLGTLLLCLGATWLGLGVARA